MMPTDVDPEWIHRDPDPAAVDRLVEALGCSRLLATVLVNRDVTDPELARRFLNPTLEDLHDPTTLPDVDAALARLARASYDGEAVVVYGDKDVDGVCGTAILLDALDSLGADASAHVPGKYDSYGLQDDTIRELAARGTDLLVTVDCGVRAIDEVALAADLGMDVIVTDHHEPAATLPDAVACVNPRRGDAEYPNPALAGGGVAFKLGEVLAEAAGRPIESYRQDALSLAMIATLGDYVPLTIENRAIARAGFEHLEETRLGGLRRVVEHCDVETIRDVPWSLVPLLNAGAEDPDGEVTLSLLTDRTGSYAPAAIERLEAYRAERREQRRQQQAHLEAQLVAKLEAQFDGWLETEFGDAVGMDVVKQSEAPSDDRFEGPPEHVLTNRDDDQGDFLPTPILVVSVDEYVGGAAISRVSEQLGRPIVTLRERGDVLQGGARTHPDVDLVGLFRDCSTHLEECWGHPGAAGFRVRPEHVEAFVDALEGAVRDRYDAADLRPTIEIDATVSPVILDEALCGEIGRIQPCGTDNPEPTFLLPDVDVEDWEVFGTDDDHVRLHPAADGAIEVVYWGGAGTVAGESPPARVDVVGSVVTDAVTGDPVLHAEDCRSVVEE